MRGLPTKSIARAVYPFEAVLIHGEFDCRLKFPFAALTNIGSLEIFPLPRGSGTVQEYTKSQR
jgi:hypothetical protein